jgi:hypothetical protein
MNLGVLFTCLNGLISPFLSVNKLNRYEQRLHPLLPAQVEDTYEQLALALGEAATVDLFKRSVFFVSIGSNDFIHYYLRNVPGVQMHYLPWDFNQLLVNSVRRESRSGACSCV